MKPLHHPLPGNMSRHTALFLFLLAVYLLTYTPRVNSSDGIAMMATAESLARRAALDVEQIRWMDLQQGTYGLDGLLYSRKGIGVPVGLLPLVWLGLVVPWFGPVSAGLLFNAVVTALTAVLISAYVQALGFTPRTGLLAALLFGLSTLAWPYAKSLFSDPFSGLLLLAAAYALLKTARHTASRKQVYFAALSGLCLGWNVATRYAEALFLPVFGLLLLYYLAGSRTPDGRRWLGLITRRWPVLAAFAAPISAVGLSLMAFNMSRYGDPFNTGYLPTETFSAVWWQGIAGQLVSPGRGLLWFSPVLWLSLAGAPVLFRRRRPEAGMALSVILIHLLLYGKWFMWHGGFAWGPRFMIPTLPFWVILLAPVIEPGLKPSGLRHSLLLLLAIAGASIQILLVLVDFSPFQGFLLDTGLPLFHPQTFFDPRYSPLLRGWAFISPQNLDLAWAWNGQINGLLLAILLGNAALAGYYLWRPPGLRFALLPVVVTLAAAGGLLAHAHGLPPPSLRQAVAALNRGVRPTDAVILNYPEATLDVLELYKGRAPVLGLNNGGFPLPDAVTRRLDQILAAHSQVWWLPNWLPPSESAVEQILLARGFRARHQDFNGQRLALFAFPKTLATRPLNQTFGRNITLIAAALPPRIEAGAALPVELRWQTASALATDYHVFIHLEDGEGQIIAQADGQPGQWTRPTTTWEVGQVIIDRHGLWLPPDIPPGPYILRVGLYQPATGERLHLPNGPDSAAVAVTVEAGQ